MLDINKCIFVIDSTTTAFMVSLIADGAAVNCIFERKEGIETDKGYELFRNFANRCLNIASCKEIKVPNKYFITGKTIFSRYWSFYRFSREVRSKYKESLGFTYIGPCTSSIMQCLTCSSDNIYYLHHGTSDYFKYYKEIEKRVDYSNGIKKIFKKVIFKYFLNLPNSDWNGFFALQGFSLINMHLPNVKWLNYKNFNNEYIEKQLYSLVSMTTPKKWVMFCPIHDIHNKNGISNDVTSYNQKNIEFIKKYISDDENIIIKCHPSVYLLNDAVINNLSDVLRDELNIVAKDVVEYIPDEIGGAAIPIEVLFRYCNFTKLICVETTALWVLKDDTKIIKICDITSCIGSRKDVLTNIIKCLSQHNMIDEHYIINI